jgi:predicted regulator of Ras-like GTPase activity (Roadblock/LC7/MglB family)
VAPPIPATPVQAPQDDKLFALNDNDIDQLFADNLGLQANENQPADDASKVNVNQAVQAIRTIAEHDEAVPPPPKIEGLGRLDVKPGEEVGPGRISQIGKFLLDPKDLAQIGRLTEADLTDTKMRILTMEEAQNLQAVLQQIHAIPGVIGSIIVGHDGILIANSMPAELDSEAMGVWSLGIFLNTQNSVKKLGHNHVHQVVSRTPSGYLIIADFGGGILVTLSEGSETERLIPLMRNITKLVAA